MQVAEGMHECTRLQIGDLRDHQRQQGIRGDVERHAEKQIRAALIKLATQFALLREELEQRVARRQRHLLKFARIPRRDDVPPAVGILFDLFDEPVDLVDRAAVRGPPIAPLRAIDAAQVAVLVRPLVPDRHAMLVQVFEVGVAAQEPEQFINDRFDVELLGREQRKAL